MGDASAVNSPVVVSIGVSEKNETKKGKEIKERLNASPRLVKGASSIKLDSR